jgi:hypothetical protein
MRKNKKNSKNSKIKMVLNFFSVNKVNVNAEVKSSTYRKLRSDLENTLRQLEKSVGAHLNEDQFNAQRKRVEYMIQACTQAEIMLLDLNKEESDHNCFHLRWRYQLLKQFLEKYKLVLNKYSGIFLEKIHHAITLNSYNGLVICDNLEYRGGEIEIIR